MTAPASFVEVVCEHGERPRSLGRFHPGVTEVYSPACKFSDGRKRPHKGPKA